jgi:hypothetical protein
LGSDEWFRAEEKRMEESALAKIVDVEEEWWDQPGLDPVYGEVLN